MRERYPLRFAGARFVGFCLRGALTGAQATTASSPSGGPGGGQKHHTCADQQVPPFTNLTLIKEPPLAQATSPLQPLGPPQGQLFTLFSHFTASFLVFQQVDKPPGHGIYVIAILRSEFPIRLAGAARIVNALGAVVTAFRSQPIRHQRHLRTEKSRERKFAASGILASLVELYAGFCAGFFSTSMAFCSWLSGAAFLSFSTCFSSGCAFSSSSGT